MLVISKLCHLIYVRCTTYHFSEDKARISRQATRKLVGCAFSLPFRFDRFDSTAFPALFVLAST